MPQGFYRLKKFRQERSRVVKFDLFSGTRLIFSLRTELFFCSKVFNLRTGQLVVPEDKNVRRELLNEAEFYRVQGIIDELRSQPFEGSLILSLEHRQILTNWLQAKLASATFTYTLIYRASRNGWNAVNFHSACDRKGPTITVVKSGNNIFGGYTEQSWERKLIHYSK